MTPRTTKDLGFSAAMGVGLLAALWFEGVQLPGIVGELVGGAAFAGLLYEKSRGESFSVVRWYCLLATCPPTWSLLWFAGRVPGAMQVLFGGLFIGSVYPVLRSGPRPLATQDRGAAEDLDVRVKRYEQGRSRAVVLGTIGVVVAFLGTYYPAVGRVAEDIKTVVILVLFIGPSAYVFVKMRTLATRYSLVCPTCDQNMARRSQSLLAEGRCPWCGQGVPR